jgi:hypothetical protein
MSRCSECWIASHPRGAPEPSELHKSRRAATRRLRSGVGSLAVGALAVGSALFAFVQQRAAEASRADAVTPRKRIRPACDPGHIDRDDHGVASSHRPSRGNRGDCHGYTSNRENSTCNWPAFLRHLRRRNRGRQDAVSSNRSRCSRVANRHGQALSALGRRGRVDIAIARERPCDDVCWLAKQCRSTMRSSAPCGVGTAAMLMLTFLLRRHK